MKTLKTPMDRLRAARRELVLDHPFFGALALRLTLKEETQGRTRTLGTDGRCIFYDPAFVQAASDAELIGLLAHEVMHPALQHHTRRGARDPRLWNDAADYAINPILLEAGLSLPVGALNETQYRGMSAEAIYEARQQPTGDPDAESEEGGPEASQDGSGTSAADASQNSGSGHGSAEAGLGLADKVGAVWDAPDPIQQAAEWQVAVKQVALAAQMMGRLPCDIRIAVEEACAPRIDWKTLLRRFVQSCAAADYSWRRPNRRYIARRVYLPEIRSEAMPPIVVAVDTSSSTGRVLPLFETELQSIVDECQPEATVVIMADAVVQRVDRFERGDSIEFHVQGLGGTDFRPVFEHVVREQLELACLIYLTDGFGNFPDVPPDFPTLWALTESRVKVPWGETVVIDPAMARKHARGQGDAGMFPLPLPSAFPSQGICTSGLRC
jgi:predicted metal-dependent peptidase